MISLPVSLNLTARIDINMVAELWVSGLRYIPRDHELLYLDAMLDAWSCRCLGVIAGRIIARAGRRAIA